VTVSDRLYRSRDDRVLTGVAGGVAEALDADPSVIRVVWALLVFLSGGIALVAYVVMAIVVPERPAGVPVHGAPETGGEPAGPRSGASAPDGWTVPLPAAPGYHRRRDPADRTRGGLVLGLVLIFIGGLFLLRQFLPFFDLAFWWPVGAIGLGVLLIVVSLAPPGRSG
jgi:phage shock protein C